MNADARLVYAPINSLKQAADNIWIVDGPVIRFGMPWPKLPFPTRMTVVRLGDDLFVHSPTPLTAGLKAEIETIGRPRWIVGPNRIHYWWIPEWHTAFAGADVYLAAHIQEQARGRISFKARSLDQATGYPWDWALATLPIGGRYMTEVDFFHRASRTLILADLIENFEPQKTDGLLMRWLTRLGGVQDPDGSMPRDMRRTFARPELRRAVQTMIDWDPERIIIAHGRWYERNGTRELRRAFGWLLG
ncbi:MAG: DUF4336 domain-containing protein [Xanthobacteraceae bacterium]|nr:DUF4336 domain-containing protein [Xanthobacteraceae bacterium]